jgi:hypothetical protein
MKRTPFLFILITLFAVMSSCCKNESCDNGEMHKISELRFYGFEMYEIDTLMIETLDQNNAYVIERRGYVLDSTNSRANGSFVFFYPDQAFDVSYDYVLYFRYKSKQFRIDNFKINTQTCNNCFLGSNYSERWMSGYKVNGRDYGGNKNEITLFNN